MENHLSSLGITDNEYLLYRALLEKGKSQAGELSRKTGIHRRNVYDALERLIQKGIISYLRENEKRVYYPTNPSRIKELLEEQKKQVDEVLPLLLNTFEQTKQKAQTSFFRGREGIKTIFEEQLLVGETIYVLGQLHNISQILQYYLPHYTKKRIEKKIHVKCIYGGNLKKTSPDTYVEVKYLPKQFDAPISTSVFGSYVSIIIWSSDNPSAILIKDEKIALHYKQQFDLLWKVAK